MLVSNDPLKFFLAHQARFWFTRHEKKIFALNFSISTSKKHLAEVPLAKFEPSLYINVFLSGMNVSAIQTATRVPTGSVLARIWSDVSSRTRLAGRRALLHKAKSICLTLVCCVLCELCESLLSLEDTCMVLIAIF